MTSRPAAQDVQKIAVTIIVPGTKVTKCCETCRHFPNDGRFNHCNAPLPEWTYHAPFPYSGRHHGTSPHDSEVHKDFGTDCSTWRAKKKEGKC